MDNFMILATFWIYNILWTKTNTPLSGVLLNVRWNGQWMTVEYNVYRTDLSIKGLAFEPSSRRQNDEITFIIHQNEMKKE
jgi:hypothetical protein